MEGSTERVDEQDGSTSPSSVQGASAPSPGSVTVEEQGSNAASSVTVIRLDGDIGWHLQADLRAAAETAIRRGVPVVIDVADVTSIGEPGLYFFAIVLRRLAGAVSAVNVHGCTRQLLERTGLITVLTDSYPSIDLRFTNTARQ